MKTSEPEAYRHRECRTCVMFLAEECYLYPTTIKKHPTEWCGQHTSVGEDRKGFWRRQKERDNAQI